MNPQSENSQFGVTVEFIEDVDTLYDFADISHVEDVMRFSRSRQEVVSYRIVESNGSSREGLRNLFDLIIEILSHEFMREDVMENASHLSFGGEGEVDHE